MKIFSITAEYLYQKIKTIKLHLKTWQIHLAQIIIFHFW